MCSHDCTQSACTCTLRVGVRVIYMYLYMYVYKSHAHIHVHVRTVYVVVQCPPFESYAGPMKISLLILLVCTKTEVLKIRQAILRGAHAVVCNASAKSISSSSLVFGIAILPSTGIIYMYIHVAP